MKKKEQLKKITVFLFLSSIFLVPITMVFTEDKSINEIENKILQKFPRFNYENVKSGRFMKNFDTYVSDQFPGRNMFLYTKNGLNYMSGQREFRDTYITSGGRLLEKYIENKESLKINVSEINNISDGLDIKKTLFLVPNSVSIYEEELPSFSLTDSQEDSFEFISNLIDIEFYTPFDSLKKNKDKYIYYNTDHHWTQLGAKLAFEEFYNKKVNSEYSLVSERFYGSYYSKAMLKNMNPDKLYAYKSFGNFENEFDGLKSETLYDVSKLDSKNKYQYFLSGDPAKGVIHGSGNGEILVIKDSFAHNFLPFLAQEFKKIHVIDPRYSNVDIRDYINQNKEIKEVLFLFSLSTINSGNIFKRWD